MSDVPEPPSLMNFAELEHFFFEVKGRMEKGEREYGGESFGKPVSTLAYEMMQEVEDIAGWGYIQWRRLVALRQRGLELERAIKALEERLETLKARSC